MERWNCSGVSDPGLPSSTSRCLRPPPAPPGPCRFAPPSAGSSLTGLSPGRRGDGSSLPPPTDVRMAAMPSRSCELRMPSSPAGSASILSLGMVLSRPMSWLERRMDPMPMWPAMSFMLSTVAPGEPARTMWKSEKEERALRSTCSPPTSSSSSAMVKKASSSPVSSMQFSMSCCTWYMSMTMSTYTTALMYPAAHVCSACPCASHESQKCTK
mmetsp:Transcript_2453/g.6294  ORF Transcript_2453/g.6294 Transcript_2453/m.6294 type:complete len:213 (+) Transcript_2453:516-1154(+)